MFCQQIRHSYNLLTHQKLNLTIKQPFKLKTADQFNIVINPDGSWDDNLQTLIKQEGNIKNELSDTFPSDVDVDTPVVKNKNKQKRNKKKIKFFKEVELSETDPNNEKDTLACQEAYSNATLKCNFCIVTFANQADLDEHNKKHYKFTKNPQTHYEKKEKKRLAERKRMEQIRKIPDKYAKWKLKMKEIYMKRKREGKVVTVHNLIPSEQKLARKKSRESSRRCYAKKILKDIHLEDEVFVKCQSDSIETQDPLDLDLPVYPEVPIITCPES